MENTKKIIFLFLIFLFTIPTTNAQSVPQGMKYQAVARTLKGEVIKNQPISMLITLQSNKESSEIYYVETHDASTNMLGLFTLVIGKGQVSEGEFNAIPWSSEDIWMEIAIKSDDDDAYNTLSNNKLLTVPYAFHASTASSFSGNNFDTNGRVPANVWSLQGNRESNSLIDKLGTTDYEDLIIVTDDIERLRITADGQLITPEGTGLELGGSLTVHGDSVAVDKDLYVGRNVYLNYDDGFNPRGETINYGKFTVDGTTDLNNSLRVNNASSTNLTGLLNVDGTTNLNNSLRVSNASSTNLTGLLNVEGITELNSALNVNNASPTNLSGLLDVDGITDLNDGLRVNNASATNLTGNLTVTGPATLNNSLAANGQVTINAAITGGGQADYNQYPLRVEGGDHGIAIKVNGTTPNRNTNFLTLFDGEGTAMGRIEGFQGLPEIGQSIIDTIMTDIETAADEIDTDDEESTTPPAEIPESVEQFFNNDYAVGAISETLDLSNSILCFAINLSAALGLCLAGDCDDPVWAAIDAVIQGIQLAGYISYNELNLGAAFESGGADYAEWLMKANSNEAIQFGEVVGVRGGLISKTFKTADQFMVVSKNPTIIGAMPDSGFEEDYKRIAFMGQVAVKVVGEVSLGDYILPSGNGDGIAIAIEPSVMKAKDFSRIIGVAWSASNGKQLFEYVNTAVGLNTNDMALMIDNMQLVMNQMQEAIVKLNPDYKPNYFDVSGEIQQANINYSSSPTLTQIVTNQIGVDQNTKKDVALQRIKKYASTVNLDFKNMPYFKEMLNNPDNQELIDKAIKHYYRTTTKLTKVLDEVNKARIKKQK